MITTKDVLAVWLFLGIAVPGWTFAYRWWVQRRDELDAWENERLALLKEIIDDAPQAELQQRQEVGVRRAILESLLEMGIDCFPEDLDPSDPRYRPPFERSVPDSPELNTALAAAVGSAGTPLVDESRRQRPVFKRPGQRSLHDKTCCIFDLVHLPSRTLIQVERHRKGFSGCWVACVYFPQFEKLKSVTMPTSFKQSGPDWFVQFEFSEVPADQPAVALEHAEQWFVRAAHGQARITGGAFALSADRRDSERRSH